MPSAARTQDELRRVSAHLYYEVMMLTATAALTTPNAVSNEVATNAFLEAFTIHARSLLQFFFPTGQVRDTDVLAVHYMADEATWYAALGAQPTTLGAVNSRVGTEIAHLSYKRLAVGPEAKGWNVPAIHLALLRLVALFVEHAPSDKLGPSWNVRRILGTPSTGGPDRGVVSTTSSNIRYAIPEPGKGTMVNTIAAPVPFKTSD